MGLTLSEHILTTLQDDGEGYRLGISANVVCDRLALMEPTEFSKQVRTLVSIAYELEQRTPGNAASRELMTALSARALNEDGAEELAAFENTLETRNILGQPASVWPCSARSGQGLNDLLKLRTGATKPG